MLILHLRQERDRLLAIPQLHKKTAAGERDTQIALTETADQVEGLARRPRTAQLQRVLRYPPLHRRPHLGRRTEEAVRGHQAPNALMGTAEVIGLDEESDPPLAVLEVRKDGPRQELLP